MLDEVDLFLDGYNAVGEFFHRTELTFNGIAHCEHTVSHLTFPVNHSGYTVLTAREVTVGTTLEQQVQLSLQYASFFTPLLSLT